MDAAGEIKLLAAVLIRAARDAVTPAVDDKPEWQQEAIRFFGLDKNQPNLVVSHKDGFSFGYICEHLGLCPYKIHKELLIVEKDAKQARREGRWLQLTRANGLHLEAWCTNDETATRGGFECSLPRLGRNKAEN